MESIQTPDRDYQRRLPCKNRSVTETIPTYGAVQIFGVEVDNESGFMRHVVDAPDQVDGKLVYFNCEAAIPPEAEGFIQTDFPALALLNVADYGAPGLDEQWGPNPGEYTLIKDPIKGVKGFFPKPWEADPPEGLPDDVFVVVQEVCRS